MEIVVTLAQRSDCVIIRNLTELYFHDFSEIEDKDVNEHGLFDYDDLDLFWLDKNRYPFLLRCNGKIAGFALIKKGFFHEKNNNYDENLIDMVDFFVMRKYRRNGAGSGMAKHVFDFLHGRWQVRVDDVNIAAMPFWKKVISEHINETYETFHVPTDSGVTYYFDNVQA